MNSTNFDVAIIGAGVVGCAIAEKISQRRLKVLILEAEDGIGRSTSSRNSGVIHSGIYYKNDFLKTSLCIEGQELLYEWSEKKSLSYKKIGKFIVANARSHINRIEELYEQAQANGCKGVQFLSSKQATLLEPGIKSPLTALYCKNTGIIDPNHLTHSLLESAKTKDVEVQLSSPVLNIDRCSSQGFKLTTPNAIYNCENLINSAGLYSDTVAAMAGIDKYKIYPCRGDYFRFKNPTSYRHLIYPARKPSDPGLGIHLTLDLAGNAKLGPDAEYVQNPNDTSTRQNKLQAFADAAQTLLNVDAHMELEYAGYGIRPKIFKSGQPEADFIIKQDQPGLINLVGIESPGLTASLAIARYVDNMLFR